MRQINFYNRGRKGAPPPPPPPPPAPVIISQVSPAAQQATNESRRSALEAELEYYPRFREEQLADVLPFAEKAAESQRQFGIPLAEEEARRYEQVRRELYPGEYQAQLALEQRTIEELGGESPYAGVAQPLTETVLGQLNQPLSPELEEAYRERFRSEEALGGRLGSSVGSASIARQLADVTEQRRQAGIQNAVNLAGLGQQQRALSANTALSYLGRAPIQTPQLPYQAGIQFGQFVGPSLGATSGIIGGGLGYTSDVYGSQIQGYGYQQQAKTARRGQTLGLVQSGIGAAGAALGAFCWVAAETFGSWEHPLTYGLRSFLLYQAPKWILDIYIKWGERMAKWLRKHSWAKSVVRPMLTHFAKKGLRNG